MKPFFSQEAKNTRDKNNALGAQQLNFCHSFLFRYSRKLLPGSETLWKTLGRLFPFPKEGSRVLLPSGFSMQFHRKDYVSFSIYKGQYESDVAHVLASLEPNCSEETILIDIGGNIGFTSFEMVKQLKGNRTSRILIFEPIAELCNSIVQNLSTVDVAINLYDIALGSKSGKASIFNFGLELNSGIATLIRPCSLPNASIRSIKVDRLDNYLDSAIKSPIHLMKLDTEGFELEVLQGATKLFEMNPPKYILIEFNLQYYTEKTFSTFKEISSYYTIYKIYRKKSIFAPVDLHLTSITELSKEDNQTNLLLVRTKVK